MTDRHYCNGRLVVFIADESSMRCTYCDWMGWPRQEVERHTGRILRTEPHKCQRSYAEDHAHLSKFYRLRATLEFLTIHLRNMSAWSKDDLERGRLSFQCRELTHRVIDLDAQIREMEYH